MTPREMINRLQLTAAKARSNASELDLGGEVNLARAADLDPLCYGTGEMSVLSMTARCLEGEPTAMDVFNLLTLIDLKSPSMITMYYARWNEELPNPIDYLRENLS